MNLISLDKWLIQKCKNFFLNDQMKKLMAIPLATTTILLLILVITFFYLSI